MCFPRSMSCTKAVSTCFSFFSRGASSHTPGSGARASELRRRILVTTSKVWHRLPAARLRLRIMGCSCGDHLDSTRVAGCPAPPSMRRQSTNKLKFTSSRIHRSVVIAETLPPKPPLPGGTGGAKSPGGLRGNWQDQTASVWRGPGRQPRFDHGNRGIGLPFALVALVRHSPRYSLKLHRFLILLHSPKHRFDLFARICCIIFDHVDAAILANMCLVPLSLPGNQLS